MSIIEETSTADTSNHLLLSLTNEEDLRLFSNLKNYQKVVLKDSILSQIKDLIKLRNPTNTYKEGELDVLAEEYLLSNGGDFYGVWVYYPWRNCLIHTLPELDFAEVRTVRNKYKISPEEQSLLAQKKVGIVGLSVGQSVALAMALERSFGELRIADFDELELSNLNRLRAGIYNLGEKKSTLVRREIAEIDPFLSVVEFDQGITYQNIDEFMLAGGPLDLLIDECDSLDIKLLMREKAREYAIPVLMDTSDRGLLDVERFDLEPTRPIFHGMVEGLNFAAIGDLPMKEKIPIVLKITGLETLSSRMKASLLEVNQSITSWPQLASAVFLGGAVAAHAGRQLLLGQSLNSGRYYIDLDDLLLINQSELEHEEHQIQLESRLKSSFEIVDNFKSTLRLSNQELYDLLTYTNLAPSGGNVQPWLWVFDKQGVLHLYHDKARSESLLDFKGTGSLIAFGAALENLRIWCEYHGVDYQVHKHIKAFEENKIASITFKGKKRPEVSQQLRDFFECIPKRITDRLNQKRVPLSPEVIDKLVEFVNGTDFDLKIIDCPEKIKLLASINGKMDWVRMLNKIGYDDFLSEIRWTPEEAAQTKDGIDLATFDFSPSEQALMRLISNRQAMQVIRAFKLGQGFTKISDDSFNSASAVALLSAKEYSPNAFLEGGAILQRIWLMANHLGVSFQPVTASLFMYHRYFKGGGDKFSEFEGELITSSFNDFNTVFQSQGEGLFLFRLSISNTTPVKSYRRSVEDTLKIVEHV